jgi:hypothetical protein
MSRETAMRHLMWLLTASVAPLALAAQTSDSGAFVITLGTDTLALERYVRTGDQLVDDMLLRNGAAVTLRHVVATVNPDGSIARLALDTKPTGASDAPLHGVATFKPDEVLFETTRSGNRQVAHVVTPTGVLPFFTYSYALYEVIGRRARALGGNRVNVSVIPFAATGPEDLTVTFPQPDSMGVAFENDAPTLFKVDGAGRIWGVDGRLSTQKVISTRLVTVDLAAAGARFANRPLGTLSPPDSLRVIIAGATLAVHYGRPAMRGRTIFGGAVVPWNQVWRTGANLATRFTTSDDLVMGGRTIPKGSYTLWTLPAPGGWKLIINRQTKAPCDGEACALPTRAWLQGTEYAPDSDLARLDLTVERLPRPVERFTISLVPQGTGGVLALEWETTRASIPFVQEMRR